MGLPTGKVQQCRSRLWWDRLTAPLVLHHSMHTHMHTDRHRQTDHEALLKAKYCPRVAAASCTGKKQKNPHDLDL